MDIPENQLVTCTKNEHHRVLAGHIELHLRNCKHDSSPPPEFLLYSPSNKATINVKLTSKASRRTERSRRRQRRPNQAARLQAALAARNQEATECANRSVGKERRPSGNPNQKKEKDKDSQKTVYRTTGCDCPRFPNNESDDVPDVKQEEMKPKLDIDHVTRRLFEQAMTQVTPGAQVDEETMRLISLRLAQCIENGLTDEDGLGISHGTGQLVPALALLRQTGEVLAYGVGYLVPHRIINPTTGAVAATTLQHVVTTTAANEEMLQIIIDVISQSLRETKLDDK